MVKNKLLVICGPTAIGKTKLALKLAKDFRSEIFSADSRQVYKGMDIGTGKDKPKDVAIHLLDVATPDEEFSVAQYQLLATEKIEEIWQWGKLPILVGGAGFYIKAIVDGIETIGFPPNEELREKLQNYTVSELQKLLEETCLERLQRMNKSDRNNPRRLVRAIEIAEQIKNEKFKMKNLNSKLQIDNLLMIGLRAPNKILYQRIDQRIDERVRQGIVKEIRALLKKGYSWKNSVLAATLGYQEFQPFFEGKATLEETIQTWKFSEHNYARRQMTWFQKDKRIHWFDVTEPDFGKKIVNLVKKWYSKNGAHKS